MIIGPIHSKEDAEKAMETARNLFSGNIDSANMPKTEINESNLTNNELSITDALILAKLTTSKSEARRLIEQGGITLDNEKVSDFNLKLTKQQLTKGVIVKKGKKVFHKIILL